MRFVRQHCLCSHRCRMRSRFATCGCQRLAEYIESLHASHEQAHKGARPGGRQRRTHTRQDRRGYLAASKNSFSWGRPRRSCSRVLVRPKTAIAMDLWGEISAWSGCRQTAPEPETFNGRGMREGRPGQAPHALGLLGLAGACLPKAPVARHRAVTGWSIVVAAHHTPTSQQPPLARAGRPRRIRLFGRRNNSLARRKAPCRGSVRGTGRDWPSGPPGTAETLRRRDTPAPCRSTFQRAQSVGGAPWRGHTRKLHHRIRTSRRRRSFTHSLALCPHLCILVFFLVSHTFRSPGGRRSPTLL